MGRRLFQRAGLLALVAALAIAPAQPASSETAFYRTPNVEGTWMTPGGTLFFSFLHRFQVGSPPAYSVGNIPTFHLSAGLWDFASFGALYATETVTVVGASQELELFAKQRILNQDAGAPVSLSIKEAFNLTAFSPDVELSVARQIGIVDVIGTVRGLGNFQNVSGFRVNLGGGLRVAATPYLSLVGDASFSPMRQAAEPPLVWGAGTLIAIPYTPHTLSLQATNASTSSIHGSSVATNTVRYGFDFTIPFSSTRQWTDIFKFSQPAPKPSARPTRPAASPPASGFDAKGFFASKCAGCHGVTGAGGFGPDLTGVEAKGDAFIATRIKAGSPKGMPPFESSLSASELTQLVEFVKGL